MALKVKLVRGMSGHTENHRETLRGLGLTRVGMERLVPDTKETQGMVAKVAYLLEVSKVKEQFKHFGRRHKRKAQAAAKAARQGKQA
jgi:large subunit ribosomal protein L30